MREIGIGLLGVGIVGGGVLKIYDQHRADLEARAGCGLRIVAAVARDVAARERASSPRPGRSAPIPTGSSPTPRCRWSSR